jgi:hypothetical protein
MHGYITMLGYITMHGQQNVKKKDIRKFVGVFEALALQQISLFKVT